MKKAAAKNGKRPADAMPKIALSPIERDPTAQANLRSVWAAAESRPPAIEAPDQPTQRALDTAKRQLEAFQALAETTTVIMSPKGPKTLLEAARELRRVVEPLIERAWGGGTFWGREQLAELLAGVEAIEGQAREALVQLMAEN